MHPVTTTGISPVSTTIYFTFALLSNTDCFADRILMPAFNAASTRKMFTGMKDICDQMVLKWQRCVEIISGPWKALSYPRFGPDHEIDPADDFTRLTLDAIALCSMSYR